MVLSDRQLRERLPDIIDPFDPSMIQPGSLDVHLGTSFLVQDSSDVFYVDLSDPPRNLMREVNLVDAEDPGVKSELTIHPGEFVLGSTMEVITVPNDLVCRIEGRSSVGRLGLIVHASAGFVDPGYHGVLTLEMFNMLRVPIVVRPGLVIAQLAFEELTSPAEEPYSGRYMNDLKATPSRYGQ